MVGLYATFPAAAYNLNQYVEEHAYETYTDFIDTNEDFLRTQSAPSVAIDYYQSDCLFLNPPINYSVDAAAETKQAAVIIPDVVRPNEIKSLYDTVLITN